MSRFDRQATEGGDLPTLLGTATEEFRRSLEHHVQQIVDAAKSQAADIERDAKRNARQKEQELDLRSQELVKGVITRASSVLDSIELVQTAISGMLAELRAEVKALESGESAASAAPIAPQRPRAAIETDQDQRVAREVPPRPEEPRVHPPRPEESRAAPAEPTSPPAEATARSTGEPSTPTPEAPRDPAPPPAEPAVAAAQPAIQPGTRTDGEPGPLIDGARDETRPQGDRRDSSAEFDQMIHGEIRRMFHAGKSREDVESFLGRFELGDTYDGLLDELYSQKDGPGRRRIFGRRRDR